MKMGIISGSHRANAQSQRVAQYLEDRLRQLSPQTETYFLSLSGNPLPLWDEGAGWKDLWKPISQKLQSCDGFVIVTPEWGGMASPAIKNFFLMAADGCLRHKAGMLVAVSSSRNGSYPISELRASSYKNTCICYTPEHLVIRDVEQMFEGSNPASENDKYIRERSDYALKVLLEYSRALMSVRQSGVIDAKKYPNGM